MRENLQQVFDGATQDELFACLHLLALSNVQQRTKGGFVSLRKSMEQLQPGADPDGQGMGQRGEREVLEEALEMVRIAAAEAADDPDPQAEEEEEQSAEKRRQLRIHVNAAIEVHWPGDAEPVAGQLENISWGGAAIHVDSVRDDEGDTVRILVPATQGNVISVDAKILRTWELEDGGYGVATRFCSLSTHDELELEKLLEFLAASSDTEGQRNYARLTQRLEIEFDEEQELQATLDDISAGGLGVTVPEPLQIGQSLQTVISALDGSCSLKLRARVVRQEPIKMGRAKVFRAGLKFEHQQDELNARIEELIRKLAGARSTRFG